MVMSLISMTPEQVSSAAKVRIFPFLVIAAAHLLASLPGMRAVFLLYSVAGFLYWTKTQKDELALLVLLLGSSFSFTSLNIWNNGLIPGLPFLLLAGSLLLVDVKVTLPSITLAAIALLGLFTMSLENVLDVGLSPLVVDLLVVASVPLAAVRFSRLTEQQFFRAFSACALITLAKVVMFAFIGIENPVLSTYTDAKFLDTLDELTGFYLLFALVLISSRNPLRVLAFALFGALVFHYAMSDNWLGYYGIGSQVLLALIFFVIFLLMRFPLGLLAFGISLIFVIPLVSLYADDSGDLKIMQLLSVGDIVTGSNIALLPHSVHVRVAEMTTFFSGDWFHQLFGGGLGGYVNLSDDFPSYLSPDDYSDQQIDTGKITTPHNLGYLLIKFGLVGAALATFFIFWVYAAARKMPPLKFALYMTFAAFLILNIGYTLKISFLLGVVWVAVRDYKALTAPRNAIRSTSTVWLEK